MVDHHPATEPLDVKMAGGGVSDERVVHPWHRANSANQLIRPVKPTYSAAFTSRYKTSYARPISSPLISLLRPNHRETRHGRWVVDLYATIDLSSSFQNAAGKTAINITTSLCNIVSTAPSPHMHTHYANNISLVTKACGWTQEFQELPCFHCC
jgi:hypothetical protein